MKSILRSGIWVLACCVSAAHATERIKANNTTALNVSSSWTGSTVPGMYDVAKWDSTVTGANDVLLGGNMSIMGLTITSPGGDISIGGNNALTNGFAGINMGVATANLTLTNQTFYLLDYASQLWTVNGGRTLTFNPSLVLRGTGAAVGVAGAGTVASAALTNDATGIIAPWAWYGTGTTTKYATVNSGSVTGFTGTAAATPANATDTTGAVNYDVAAAGTFGAGAAFNTLRYAGSSGTLAGNFAANGLLNSGSGGLTFSGTTTVGPRRELVVVSPDTTRSVSFSGAIADNIAGASSVTLTGGGRFNFNADSTYSGVTVLSAGSLYINKSSALGSTAGGTVIYDNGSAVTGGLLYVSGNITLAEPITFVGTGDNAPWNSALSGVNNGGTNTLTGPITLAMSAGVRLTAGGAGATLNINAPITRTGAGSTLILGGGGAGGVLNVNALIDNKGGAINLHSGPGTIVLNVASNNIGDMNVQYQHVLKMGATNALGTLGNLQVGSGNTQTGTAPQGTLDMAGTDQTVNGFYGDGDSASAPPSTRVVTNTAAGMSTLTMGSNNGGGTFRGMFGANLAVVKNGSGTEVFCGPNFYTGGTTINAGLLVLSNAVNHGTLTVNGGTFRFPTALTVNGSLAGTGGTIDTLTAGTVLTVNQTSNTTFSGAIINAGSLVKSGTGILTLSGANTFSGGVSVAQGTLVFAKTASKPALGGIAVGAGANLGLGLGGAGCFTSSDVDALWSGTLSGVTLDATSLVAIDTSAADATYSSSQTTRGLIKTGTNTLTLSGVNTYTGGTYIQAGVLSIPTTASLPGWNTTGSYWVSRDAGLAVGNAVSDADFATLSGTGNFADSGCIGFDTSVSNRTYSGAISNTVNGALGFVKVGTNTLTLTADSSYDGNAYISGGRVVIRKSAALGSTNGYIFVTRVGGTNSTLTDSTGQLQLDGSASPLTINKNFVILGDQQYAYGGALRNTAGNNVINGSIAVGASGRIGIDGGNLTLNGKIFRASTALNPMFVLSPNTGSFVISNTIDVGTGLVNFHSGGTTVLCAAGNTWGSCQIQYSGIVRLGVDEGLSSGKRVTFGNNEPGNGLLDLYGYNQTIGGLYEYGNAASKPNNIVTNGRPASLSTLTISQSAGTADYFSGRFIGAFGIVKAGAVNSSLALAGANTFTGDTGLAGGVLIVSNQFALMNSTLNATNANGSLRFGAGLTSFAFGGLAGSVGFGLTNTLGTAVVLTVGSNNASTVFSGVLSGPGGLTKVGTGTLTLAGNNTYTGATTLAQGTLAFGCDYALSAASPIVLCGGTLAPGNTAQTLGPLTLAGNGGTIALGDGSGSLSFADSSAQSWTGLINVTGLWTPKSIRVGTGSTAGLSFPQTHSFSYNGQRIWVQVDANGYLRTMTGTLIQVK